MKNINYDVVIIGGGTSGCACAYNCAIRNLKTLLVEKNNYLGGLMTGGLVVPVMKSSVEDLNCNYYKKLVEISKKYNAQITYKDKNDGWFNPELLKIILADLLTSDEISNNLDILFNTDIIKVEHDENFIREIILESKMLSIPINATHYIDATGNGKLFKLSGAKFLSDNDIKQQNSLRFMLSNVDIEKFCIFLNSIGDNEDITNTYRNDIDTNNELHFTTASTWDANKKWALDKYLIQGVRDGVLKESDRSYFQIFSVAGASNTVAFNCPRLNNFNDNPYKSSLELINGYKAIYRLFTFVRKYFPGFENSIISNIATMDGVREEGRIKSKYIYLKDDLISGKTFNNKVLASNYSIDIHSADKNTVETKCYSNYQLPVESLISADYNNLFAIGKLVGAEFVAHSALRVQKSCMSMGEAVADYIAKIKL